MKLSDEHLNWLPLFPLPEAVFFPGSLLPLHVFEPRYRDMARWCLDERWPLAIARIVPGAQVDHLGDPPVDPVCGVGRVVHHKELPDGRYGLVLRGVGRVSVQEELDTPHLFRVARVTALHSTDSWSPSERRAGLERLSSLAGGVAQRWPEAAALITQALKADNGEALVNALASLVLIDPEARQRQLAEPDLSARADFIEQALTTLMLQPGGLGVGGVEPQA